MLKRVLRRRGVGPDRCQSPVESLEHRLLLATFAVTTTADSGPGSLRQAIIDANNAPGADDITFAIGTGPQTISPLTPLDPLSDTAGVTIAGNTQPGFTPGGAPLITLDGTSAGTGAGIFGLEITGGNSSVVALTIQNFEGAPLRASSGSNSSILGSVMTDGPLDIDAPLTTIGGPNVADRNVLAGVLLTANADGSTVENNRIGTDAAGGAALPGNSGLGVQATDADDVTVLNNVISGNAVNGVTLTAANDAVIQSNVIGVTAGGATALGNGEHGIGLVNSDNATIASNLISGNAGAGISLDAQSDSADIQTNTIGTNSAGAAALANAAQGIISLGGDDAVVLDNLISGNTGAGVRLEGGATGWVIARNRIGTNASGSSDVGNGGAGIDVNSSTGVSQAAIGGLNPTGDANIIAFNDAQGVLVSTPGAGTPSTGTSIRGNQIFNNALLGIDLASPAVGRTNNDADDSDTGANNLQNFPTLIQATSSGGNTTIGGILESNAGETFRIELFTDTAGSPAAVEGRTFLGFANATTNASGVASFNVTVPTVVTPGQLITATATDADGSTSEFSDTLAAGTTGPDIQVSGNGVTITSGDPTPSTNDLTAFGSANIGETPVTQTFSIANTGQSSLDLTVGSGPSVTITGGGGQFTVSDQPNSTVATGQSSTFAITFTPTAAGTQTATVEINSNDPDENPYTFTISGQGVTVVPAPEIEISGDGNPIPDGDDSPIPDDDTDFGSLPIGDTPVTSTFTIQNAGQQPLSLNTVTIGGAAAGQFAVQTQPSGTVAAGQSTTFTIAFNPTAGGLFEATVSVPSNDDDEDPYTFAIRGIGTAAAGDRPTAVLLPMDQQPEPVRNSTVYEFVVRYVDDQGLSVGTFDNNDLVVTGPNSFSQSAAFVRIAASSVGQADVVYRITAPGGTLDPADDGTYTVTLQANQVQDTGARTAVAGSIGTLTFNLTNARTLQGEFGVVNGRRQRLQFVEQDGTIITLTLTAGLGRAFTTPNNRIDLEVTSTDGRLTLGARRGNGRAELEDVRVTGSLLSFSGKNADMTGVFSATQALGKVTLGTTTGATISTPSPITAFTVRGAMTATQLFSGARLGDDGRFGGTGDDADSFSAGQILRFNVTGSITDSLIAAGLNPVDDQLLNENGTIIGGSASSIGRISVRGAVDADTVFAAGAFPARSRLGTTTVLAGADPRFDSTP